MPDLFPQAPAVAMKEWERGAEHISNECTTGTYELSVGTARKARDTKVKKMR